MEMIMGSEEALKISGENTIEAAAEYFHSTLVSSFIITNGANDLFAGSNGVLFENTGIVKFPVSKMIEDRLKSNPQRKGDTTGCGENFAGGIITSIALQLKTKKGKFQFAGSHFVGRFFSWKLLLYNWRNLFGNHSRRDKTEYTILARGISRTD
jgi:hypothetical protein